MAFPQKKFHASPPDSRFIPPSGENLNKLSLRALFSTEDAHIINENTRNVLIDTLDAQDGIAEISISITERQIVTVSGSAKAVAKAYGLIVSYIILSSPSTSLPRPSIQLRLLIPNSLMGAIIGRNGVKIKEMREASGAHIFATKDLLAQSTERIVEVQGTPEAIRTALEEICGCLLKDWERGQVTVFYTPSTAAKTPDSLAPTQQSQQNATQTDGKKQDQHTECPALPPSPSPSEVQTQNISIPSDMLGRIIGQSGSNINEIRRRSGARITNAKTPQKNGEHMFTIVGTPAANATALLLISQQLENEIERRIRTRR